MSQRPAERCVHCGALFLPGDAFCTACGWCIGWLGTAENISPVPALGEHGSHYRLLRKRAQGSTATVYAARDLRSNAIVAMKVITGDSTTLSRSLREYAVGRMLKYDGIVPLLRYWLGEQCLVSVMPWIEGVSLRELLDAEGPIEVEQCVWIVREIALALAAAHHAGVVHRDVKPANILIDLTGRPLLCDFGVAKLQDDPDATGVGFPAGSPSYMSPEQLAGTAEPASDQYALGIVAYEILTGAKPYIGSSALVVAAHIGSPPPSFGGLLDARERQLPAELSEVLDRMVQKDPAGRMPDMRTLANALAPHQNDDVRQVMAARVSRVRYRRYLTERVQLELAQQRSAGPSIPAPLPSSLDGAPPVADVASALGAAADPEVVSQPSSATSGAPAATAPRAGWGRRRQLSRLLGGIGGIGVIAGVGGMIWMRQRDRLAIPAAVPIAVWAPDTTRSLNEPVVTPAPPRREIPVASERSPDDQKGPEPALRVADRPTTLAPPQQRPSSEQAKQPIAVVPDSGVAKREPVRDTLPSSEPKVVAIDSTSILAGEFRRQLGSVFGRSASDLAKQLSGGAAERMLDRLKRVKWEAKVLASSDADAARGLGTVLFCITNGIGGNEEWRAVVRRERRTEKDSSWLVDSWTNTKRNNVSCSR